MNRLLSLFAVAALLPSAFTLHSATYELITDDSGLVSGSKYLLVCEELDKALSSDNGASQAVTITDHTITLDDDSPVKVYTLAAVDGGYTLQTADGLYLNGPSSGGNTISHAETAQVWPIEVVGLDQQYNVYDVSLTAGSRYLTVNGSGVFRTAASKTYLVQMYRQQGGQAELEAPTFSPGAGTVEAGTVVTISAVEGATLVYSLNGGEEITADGNTAQVTINETTTITAYATKDDEQSASVTATYVINLTYSLVESNDQILAGYKYIIVCEDKDIAMKADGQGQSVTIADHTIELPDNDPVLVFTLGGTAGAYTLRDAEGKYLTAETATNSIPTLSDEAQSWSLTTSYNSGEGVQDLRMYLPDEMAHLQVYNDGLFKIARASDIWCIQLYRLEGEMRQAAIGDLTAADEGNAVALTDNLTVAFISGNTLYAQGNELDSPAQAAEGEVDFMAEANLPVRYQNKWVAIEVPDASAFAPGDVITASGTVASATNPTLTDAIVTVTATADPVQINTYCPASFAGSQVGGTTGRAYFFVQPQPMEVAIITWAEWNGTSFQPETLETGTGLQGGFDVDWSIVGEQTLETGVLYQFQGVIRVADTPEPAPRREGTAAGSGYVVAPTHAITTDHVVTGVSTVGADRQIAGCAYYTIDGRSHAAPAQGMNIVVTRYADGSKKTSKIIY